MQARLNRGLTLTDLLVGLGLIALVVGVLFPNVVVSLGSRSNQVRCASNLRTIGQALFMYSNEDVRTGAFPRVRHQVDGPPTAWTNPKGAGSPTSNPKEPFAPTGPAANDVTAALYLTLRTQDIEPDVFNCPDTSATTLSGDKHTYLNFDNQSHLSYSYQNPYASTAALQKGYKFTNSLTSEFPILADMNPGTPQLLTLTVQSPAKDMGDGNSPNHGRTGQNVLYADGHTDWAANPFVGVQRDNIYTFAKPSSNFGPLVTAGIVGSPGDAYDTILLPTWDPAIPMPAAGLAGLAVLPVIVSIILLLVIAGGVVAVVLVMRKKQGPGGPPVVPMGH